MPPSSFVVTSKPMMSRGRSASARSAGNPSWGTTRATASNQSAPPERTYAVSAVPLSIGTPASSRLTVAIADGSSRSACGPPLRSQPNGAPRRGRMTTRSKVAVSAEAPMFGAIQGMSPRGCARRRRSRSRSRAASPWCSRRRPRCPRPPSAARRSAPPCPAGGPSTSSRPPSRPSGGQRREWRATAVARRPRTPGGSSRQPCRSVPQAHYFQKMAGAWRPPLDLESE